VLNVSDGAWFHEDDRGQVEILPIESRHYVESEFVAIRGIEVSPFGFRDIHLREQVPITLESLNISRSDVVEALCPPMTLLEEVYSGYSSERYRVEKSIALLHDDESPIYVEANDNDIVTVIWMAAASRYLGRIPFAERLILVDWNQTAWMPLGT